MKKALALLLALAMILSFAACAKKEEPKAEEPKAEEPKQETPVAKTYDDYMKMDIAELKKEIKTVSSGKLTIVTSPDFAPYEFYVVDDKGNAELAGFDIAIGKYVAEYLGLEADIIPMDFDGVLVELAAKKADLACAGLSPSPDRMDKMDFSDLYYLGGQSFCVAKANVNKWNSLDELNDKKIKVAAQIGSIQMDLANQYTPDADIVELTKVTDIIAELLSGKIDGAYIETAVAETYAKNYPDLTIKFDVKYDDAEGSAVGVYKDNAALLAGVNKAIAEAISSGKMAEFVATANEQASGHIYEGLLENK